LFLYSGWDVAANLNEETRDGRRIAGQGSVIAIGIVAALFLSFSTITLLVLSDDKIVAAGTNLLFVVAQKVLPHPWDDIAIFAVMVSTVGALETSILQFTRTLFSMGRDGVVMRRFARLHSVYRTPFAATVLITALGLVLLFLSSYLPSVSVVIKDSIDAIGFQVAIYYGLAGMACGWYYRRQAVTSLYKFVFLLAWPLLGGAFLFFIALYSVPTFDLTTNVVGLGGIAIGIVPYLLGKKRVRPVAGYAP
jgi:amino acid transporter